MNFNKDSRKSLKKTPKNQGSDLWNVLNR